MNLDAVAIVLDLMQPPVPPGALDFNVASWGLMNPGIGIRFDNTSTHKNALLGQAGIFAQFSRISNNQRTWSFLTPTNAALWPTLASG